MVKLGNVLAAIFHGFIGPIGLAIFVMGIAFSGVLLYRETVLNNPIEMARVLQWTTAILAIIFGVILLLVSLRKYGKQAELEE